MTTHNTTVTNGESTLTLNTNGMTEGTYNIILEYKPTNAYNITTNQQTTITLKPQTEVVPYLALNSRVYMLFLTTQELINKFENIEITLPQMTQESRKIWDRLSQLVKNGISTNTPCIYYQSGALEGTHDFEFSGNGSGIKPFDIRITIDNYEIVQQDTTYG